jgi:hypothetical protein
MRFKNNDNSYTDMKVRAYKPQILIDYKLIETSGGNFLSIDRGVETDRYATTITFRGLKDAIRSLVNELTILRANGKQIIFDEFNEPLFGDNVDHSGIINCVIDEFGVEESVALNVEAVTITFLATDLSFLGTGALPELQCLAHESKGYADWSTRVNETYNRSNYFVDRESDIYVFEGTYSLSLEDNKNLLSFWKIQRGIKFTINEVDWGVERMFGGHIASSVHDVIVVDMDYSRVSPNRRNTKIELVKVG